MGKWRTGLIIHSIFICLHILSILFGVLGLFISIPLHIMVYLLLRNKSGGNQKQLEPVTAVRMVNSRPLTWFQTKEPQTMPVILEVLDNHSFNLGVPLCTVEDRYLSNFLGVGESTQPSKHPHSQLNGATIGTGAGLTQWQSVCFPIKIPQIQKRLPGH